MFNILLYLAALGLFFISLRKDPQKTRMALHKSWKSFLQMVPLVLGLLLFSSTILAFVDTQTISALFGKDSGSTGLLLAGFAGSVVLIPAFVAYPLAATLLQAGAGYAQVTLFITTLMMVGLITMPLESMYFGKKTAVWRNAIGLGYSIALGFIMGWLYA